MIKEAHKHRDRLKILEAHLGDDFYKTGQYHNNISDAIQSYADQQNKMPSDEEISNYIENYINKYGYKMHDLSSENECLTHSGVENIIEWIKNELKKNH